MKPKLFILSLVWILTTYTYGQDFIPFQVKAYQIAPDERISVSSEPDIHIAWGYCENDIVYSIGVGKEAQLSAAIYVPQVSLGIYQNAKIAGLRIGLTADGQNVSAFLKEGNDLEVPDKMSTTSVPLLGRGYHDILFRVPYQIIGDVIVGYTSTGTNQIGYDGAVAYRNANFLRYNNQWLSTYDSAVNGGWGSLCIQLLLTADQMPEREMGLESILNRTQEQNKPFVLRGVARNMTTYPVERYEISCKIDGGEEVTFELDSHLEINEADTFSVELPPLTRIGVSTLQVTLTKVNGEEDADNSNNTLTQTVNVIEEGCYFPQKVVVEEGTSIYCGFCPRGIVVMESMKLRYPDTFIGIAVHSEMMGNDPMVAYEYQNINAYFSDGLPCGIVNRKESLCGDPLFFEQYYEKEVQKLSMAKVTLLSVSDVKDDHIDVQVETTFNQNMSGRNYRLAFILLENNVTGFQQSNMYAGGNYGAMNGFEEMADYVSIPFNDVARGIWDYEGLENSIPANVEKKVPYDYSYQIPVSADVQDKRNLEVVAMLLDINSGEIIQADKLAVGQKAPTMVRQISSEMFGLYVENGTVKVHTQECVCLHIYTPDGLEVPNQRLSHGIYIVRATVKGKTYTKKMLI